MYHFYRLKRWVSISWTNKLQENKDTNSIHLKRQYKIQTFLYMSNNNSSANIIINSMIHHSKLSLKATIQKNKKSGCRKEACSEGEFWWMSMLPVGIYYMETLETRLVRRAWRNFRLTWVLHGLAQHRPQVWQCGWNPFCVILKFEYLKIPFGSW